MTNNPTNAVSEAEIRDRIEVLLDAVRTGDLAVLKTVFAPDVVSFDIQPPLRHVGAYKKMANWQEVFDAFQVPLEYDVRDLTVLVDGDLAVVYSLNHMNAAMTNGGKIDYWLRWTSAWRKIDGEWLVVHDQVSVPTDFAAGGRAAMELTP